VIVAPGFLGFKDWGFFPYVSERICQAGFLVLTFSHSLCGVADNLFEITDQEAFARNSTSQELKDWDLILDTILSGRLHQARRSKLNRVGIVGHSRGGSYAILMARKTPQIQSIVAWGAIETFHRYGAESVKQWRATGSLPLEGKSSRTPLKLGIQALDALERNYERLDVMAAVRSVNIPILLLHGREDRRVPLAEGKHLLQAANPYFSQLYIIESAGHSFRTSHPFTAPSLPLSEAVTKTVSWLERTLTP